MRNRIIIIAFILIVGIVIFIFIYFRQHNLGTEIKIKFVCSQKHNNKDLSCEGLLNDWEWGILCELGQKKNWEEKGYKIPFIDLSQNYLIMSRYRIKRLYQKPDCDECMGVPDGIAIFDRTNSDKNYYYFYLMPKISLSQGGP